MNVIIKLLLIVFALILLSKCEKDEPNHHIKIPDDNFFNALIELEVDKNSDGKISLAEAEELTFLDVSNKSISKDGYLSS